MRARARAAPRRRIQLQPAHQGSRRGVDLRHPRAGRRQDLRRGSRPHAGQARGGEAASSTATRGARDVEVYRAGTRAAHRRRHRSRRHRARRPPGAGRRGHPRERVRRQARDQHVGRRAQSRRARSSCRRRPRATRFARRPAREIPAGGTRALPLSSLASVHVDYGRTQINREQGGRFLALKGNIEGRDMGSFVDEAAGAGSRSEVQLPEGYYLTWGGEFENQRRAMRRLHGDRADLGAGDLRAPLHGVRRRAAGAGRAPRRALRDRGRHLRALLHPHRALASRRRSASSPSSAWP